MIKKTIQKKFQKGSAIYFAVIIMAILLAMAIAFSFILIRQIRVTKKVSDSAIAFYAADTGLELAMNNFPDIGVWEGYLDLNNNGIQDPDDPIYQSKRVEELSDPECYNDNNITTNFCIISLGEYKNLQRKIFLRH